MLVYLEQANNQLTLVPSTVPRADVDPSYNSPCYWSTVRCALHFPGPAFGPISHLLLLTSRVRRQGRSVDEEEWKEQGPAKVGGLPLLLALSLQLRRLRSWKPIATQGSLPVPARPARDAGLAAVRLALAAFAAPAMTRRAGGGGRCAARRRSRTRRPTPTASASAR